jgi:hypothetical protein
VSYELVVDGGHLRQGLRWFEKVRKIRATEKALISFDRTFMLVEALDRGFVARASGEWPGTAKVNATLVAALAKAPPAAEDVRVAYADGKLRIGSLSVACEWQPVSVSMMNIRAAPDWVEALAMKYRLPRGRIVAEGLAERVEDAERQMDRLIVRCAKSLAPLHVSEADLRELVEKRLIAHLRREPDC